MTKKEIDNMKLCMYIWGGPEYLSRLIFSVSPSPFLPPAFPLSLSVSFSLQRGLMRLGCWIPEQLTAPLHTHRHTNISASIHLPGAKRHGDKPAPSERKHLTDSSSLSLRVWHRCFIFLPPSSGIWQLFDRVLTLHFSSQTICLTSREGQKVIRESSGSFTAAQFLVS